nr:hypothetical protein [Tanacetum cinerariifolium]
PKVSQEKPSNPSLAKKASKGKVAKVCKGKNGFQLVDEEDQTERAATDKTNSEGDTKILNISEEQGEDVADKVNLEEKTSKINEGQTGSDPGKTPESRPPPERALSSRIFTLKLRDLPHKINQTINEVIKEAVHVALQAFLRDRFRELPKADMKEMLHQRMFESGSFKTLLEHEALYEALKASIECANRDEFLAKKDKSRKRRRDDQAHSPPLPDSDLSKNKRHNSEASGSKQPPAP